MCKFKNFKQSSPLRAYFNFQLCVLWCTNTDLKLLINWKGIFNRSNLKILDLMKINENLTKICFSNKREKLCFPIICYVSSNVFYVVRQTQVSSIQLELEYIELTYIFERLHGVAVVPENVQSILYLLHYEKSR